MTNPINTLLIANRGEVACRIMHTANAMGLKTVAVHSEIDRNARHVRMADISYDLGGAKPTDSYLKIDHIIEAAKATGADAIHPGYGFLAENSGFAQAIADAGLLFLGPPASAIDAMGSKSAAKNLMDKAGVPLVPGYHGEDQDYETFRAASEKIGYPVLLKATAGGGGKGMKVVDHESELKEALASAQREAQSSFGDPKMLVEKFVLQPRHVEIQVFADHHGNCVYLYERDCSIQRRHQKVVEEAPAPGMTPELRKAMGEAAVKAASAIGYVGAGTVEFLLDARGEFFFMEMNTRLQVEHPITELITGEDLVAWQIRIARGEPLPLQQENIPLNGHAMEVRLYAEDPDNDFLPATGTLEVYREPATGFGRRVDSGIEEGDSISPFYDPMVGKLIAWGENREEARQRLLSMLKETHIYGVQTNLAFLSRILAHPAFAAAELDTGFIERHEKDLFITPAPLPEAFWQLAGCAWALTQPGATRKDDVDSPWSVASGWRSVRPQRYFLNLECAGEERNLNITSTDLQGITLDRNELQVTENGIRKRIPVLRKDDLLYLEWNGQLQAIRQVDSIARAEADNQQQGGLVATMNGIVVEVLVQQGDQVDEGATLVILEAMKMEHSIQAPYSGTITGVFCNAGDLVEEGLALVELDGGAE